MIIQGKNKDLVATVVSASDGLPFISGTVYAVVRLESTDGDDGYYWDSVSTWVVSPSNWPTATHLKAGQWIYELTASAFTGSGKVEGIVHYTFIDGLGIDNELSASVVSGGGEHVIKVDVPRLETISGSIWNAALSDHQTAGSTGKALSDASGSLVDISSSIWTGVNIENIVWNTTVADHQTAGSAGKFLSEASGSISSLTLPAISASVWNATISNHQTAGSAGKLLSDASGSLSAMSASIWNAQLSEHSGTVGTTAEAIANASFSGTVHVYESEPTT